LDDRDRSAASDDSRRDHLARNPVRRLDEHLVVSHVLGGLRHRNPHRRRPVPGDHPGQPGWHGWWRPEARRDARGVSRVESTAVWAVRRDRARRSHRSRAAGHRCSRPKGSHPVWPVPCRGWGHGTRLGRTSFQLVGERVRRMSARGFALAELIVILAIAGVLATLVAPTLWSYARTATLQAAARGTDASGAIKISDSGALRISTTANVVFTSLGAASPAGTYTLTNPVTNATRAVVVAASGRVSVR